MPETMNLGGAVPKQPTPARRFDLVTAVRDADRTHCLFERGSTVVIGVSGGGDSVALLYAMHEYAPESGVSLHVSHLDHLMREESTDEAAFVAQLTDTLGVKCTLAARDVRALARETGRGLEDAARLARYGELAQVARRVGADTVAVAHTYDDQAETVVMNLLRGTGLDGLRGMRVRAPFPIDADTLSCDTGSTAEGPSDNEGPRPTLVRPMLQVTRQQARDYLVSQGRAWREDESNDDLRFLRSRIRHEILPLLEEINPRARAALVRASQAASGDLEVVQALAGTAYDRVLSPRPDGISFDRAGWQREPLALRRRMLRRAVAALRGSTADLSWEHVASVVRLADEGTVGRAVSLPGGIRVSLGSETLDIVKLVDRIPPPRLSGEPSHVTVPGITKLPGDWTIEAELLSGGAAVETHGSDRWVAVFDASVDSPHISVRARRAGDRMQPAGMAGRHKSLQDLFVDAKVPRELRDGWPVFVRGNTVLWVPGLRLSERAAPPTGAERLLRINVHPPSVVATLR